MSDEPDSLILRILRDMRAELSDMRSEIGGVRAEMGGMRAEMATKPDLVTLRADLASDILTLRKELGDQVVGLRRAVVEYHSSVIGHGILISELEARVRRVEQHLDLPAQDSH
jgi:hypothetical protein